MKSNLDYYKDSCAVMDLKKKILVKISQWRQSDNNSKNGLQDLLGQCESVTNENNNQNAYLEYLICE